MPSSLPSFTAEFLHPLRSSLSTSAQVVLPSDVNYNDLTTPWNLDFKGRPCLVIRVASTSDVVVVVKFIRQHSLPFTVGCGLHSRYSLLDGHVLIHLGGMRGVTVDPQAKVARVQGGAWNGDFDAECSKYHLHATAGTYPNTGIGGLILGGGIGYLDRRLGLSIDNLIEVEIVTAEGKVLRANDNDNSDLFWAVRGAGFNFGVVTEFVMKLHRVGHQIRQLTADDEAIAAKHNLPPQDQLEHLMVYGILPYPFTAFSHITDVLETKYVQPGVKGPMADRSLCFALASLNTPQGPMSLIQFVHIGDVYDGYRLLDRFIDDVGEPLAPVDSLIKPDTYLSLQYSLSSFTPPGGYHYERVLMAEANTPQLTQSILTTREQLKDYPGLEKSMSSILVKSAGGAVTEFIGRGAFSETQRKGNYCIIIDATYDHERTTKAKALEWANKARDLILPHCTTSYTNSNYAQAGSRVIYGTSLDRLRQVKQRYDPTNFFCNNQNVVPAEMDENVVENAQTRD